MLTKEFEEKLKSKKFKCHNIDGWLYVDYLNQRTCYGISKDKIADMMVFSSNAGLEEDTRLWLQKLVYKYSRTPIAKREPEQMYYVHIVKGSKTGYLNYILSANGYFVDTNSDSDDIRVIFTQREIDQLKQHDDLAIDWDKALEPVEVDQ